MQKYWNKLKAIWSKPSKGFGDTFAKITKSFGIQPCDECERRRVDWNERLAYAKKEKEFEAKKENNLEAYHKAQAENEKLSEDIDN
jgi:hypothetical protein